MRKRHFKCCSNCRRAVAPVPDYEIDGLLKEKTVNVSGFAAQLKETPVAKKRIVMQWLMEVVDLLKDDYNPC